jgi:hypothetical protein
MSGVAAPRGRAVRATAIVVIDDVRAAHDCAATQGQWDVRPHPGRVSPLRGDLGAECVFHVEKR